MKPSGFFSIHVQVPDQAQAPTGRRKPDEAKAEEGDFSVRLSWMHGEPYLTDLGSAGSVLLNSTPIEPNRPVGILAGDTITIGNAHLTWLAEAVPGEPRDEPEEREDPRATLPLPATGTVQPSAAAITEEPPRVPAPSQSPEVEGGEPAPAVPADATMYIPKDVASKVRAAARHPDLAEPSTPVPAPAPAPETPGESSADTAPGPREVQESTAIPAGEDGPHETLVVPKEPARPPPGRAPGQATPGPPFDTPDPTLVVPRTPAKPPAPGPATAREPVPGQPPSTGAPDDSAIYKTAWVDMAQIAQEDPDLEFDSTTILRDTETPHLVVHTPDRTWAVPFTAEEVTIGRGRRNDIPLDDEAVSQHHALVERRGDGFLIRDTGSRNGVWLGTQGVDTHWLKDGDVLSVGRAKLVFKGGFTSDELTLVGPPRIEGKPERRPVVFVPGLMGSELWIGSERLWPDPKTLIANPEVFRLPGDPRIEARGIVNDVVIVPHLIQSRQYSAMGDYLVAGLGYTRGKDLLEFGYDWRQDVRLSAQRLAEAVEGWQVEGPVAIIAHSLGTLVTRYYVERLGGQAAVERVILMGGPYYGTPKGLAAILYGPGILPFGMAAERMLAVLSTFPSSYQILPAYPCAVDQHGATIDLLEDETWLPEHQRRFLRAARSFRQEVGTVSSVPAVSVFGYGLKTKMRVKFDRGPDGLWQKAEFFEDTAGDQSVPSGSAVLKDSDIHPVFQEHGSLYVDDDVRMRLKVELTRSTRWQGKWK